MRKLLIAISTFMTVHIVPTYAPIAPDTLQAAPSYAKWGRLAMKEVHVKYPNADIIDYLHEGSASQGDLTIEKFKLWLKEEDKEFGVFVTIKYTTATENVTSVEFQETAT